MTTSTPLKGRQGRSRLPCTRKEPVSGPGRGQGQTRSKRVLLGGPTSPSPCPGLEAISSHSWGQHKHGKHRVSYQILSFFMAQLTQEMPPPIFKAQSDFKVNLRVYSHSSTRSDMHASSTPKSDQRWGSDSHLESFNQSFEYSPVHNHLLCIICSGAPWLGTPGWHRHWEAAVAMAKWALGSARLWEPYLNAGSNNFEALKGKSPPNATVWLP